MQQPPRLIQNVFVLLLLAVFAVLSTFLVLMGAQVYRSTVERSSLNNDSRIISAIVRSAVWAEDGGDIQVQTYDGIPVLEIVDYFDNDGYVHRLFCHDDLLWESYTSAERGFDIESGDSLCELSEFVPSLDGHMLTIHMKTPDGEENVLQLYLRAGGAES